MFYLIASPFHNIPVILRSWRILCIFQNTPNWNCKMNTEFRRMHTRRTHSWMLIRMFVGYTPFAIAVGIGWQFCNNQTIALFGFTQMALTILQFCYQIAGLVITWRLHKIRGELHAKHLDETKNLRIYAILCLVETVWSASTLGAYNFKADDSLVVVYAYGRLFLVILLWSASVGRNVYRVVTYRNVGGDEKPITTQHTSSSSDEDPKKEIPPEIAYAKNLEISVDVTGDSPAGHAIGLT